MSNRKFQLAEIFMTSAGRNFWISSPTDGLKSTHHISPRTGCLYLLEVTLISILVAKAKGLEYLKFHFGCRGKRRIHNLNPFVFGHSLEVSYS